MEATIKTICFSFFRTMLWFVVIITCATFFHLFSNIILVDFLNVNPYRSRLNAVSTVLIFLPLVLIIASIGVGLVFTGSQVIQAVFVKYLLRRHSLKRLYAALLIVPLTTVLTWYCYDYLTPSDFNLAINTPADWQPYKHGLTLLRYLKTFAIQASITLVCLIRLRFELEKHYSAAKKLILALLAVGIVLGIGNGIRTGSKQNGPMAETLDKEQHSVTLSDFKPVHEWKSATPISGIKWSSDGASLFAMSAFGGQLSILNEAGILQAKSILPIPYTYHLVIDPSHIVMVGDNRTNVVFSAIEIPSGKAVFQEQIPTMTEPGSPQAAIHFALSQDGATLASGYNALQSGQPISLYDTKQWAKRAVISLPNEASGVNEIVFSPTGNQLAFETEHAVTVVDLPSGKLVRSIAIDASSFAISRNGKMIAIEESDLKSDRVRAKGIKIFQLESGAQVAEYSLEHPGKACLEDDDCQMSSPIFWAADDQSLIFVSDRKTLHIWKPFSAQVEDDMASGLQFSPDLAMSPDGKKLAVAAGSLVSFYNIP